MRTRLSVPSLHVQLGTAKAELPFHLFLHNFLLLLSNLDTIHRRAVEDTENYPLQCHIMNLAPGRALCL